MTRLRVHQKRVDINAIADQLLQEYNVQRESFKSAVQRIMANGLNYQQAKVLAKSEMNHNKIFKHD